MPQTKLHVQGISEVQPAHEHGQSEIHVEGRSQSSSAATGNTWTVRVPKQNSQSLLSVMQWVGQTQEAERQKGRGILDVKELN